MLRFGSRCADNPPGGPCAGAQALQVSIHRACDVRHAWREPSASAQGYHHGQQQWGAVSGPMVRLQQANHQPQAVDVGGQQREHNGPAELGAV